MSEIFREIDEELRRDNLGKLWARYGIYVIGLAILLVVATGAVVGWRAYQASVQEAEGARFAHALDLVQKNELGQASDTLALLARDGGGGIATLARLQEASLRARSGDVPAAIAAYKSLASNPSVDPIYRDLATLLAALREVSSADPKTVIAEVAPLTALDNPWRPSALEITALAQLRAGDKTKARDTYKGIADDLSAPQALRGRAAEMAAALAS